MRVYPGWHLNRNDGVRLSGRLDRRPWASGGSGFTSAITQAEGTEFFLQVWWKIAASEPASWTWTPTTPAWRSLACASFSGATGSGPGRVDVSATTSGAGLNGGALAAPAVTTTAASDLLTFAHSNFNGDNPTSVSGAGPIIAGTPLGGTTIAYNAAVAQGATATSTPQGLGTEDFVFAHVAFFLDVAASGVTANAGVASTTTTAPTPAASGAFPTNVYAATATSAQSGTATAGLVSAPTTAYAA